MVRQALKYYFAQESGEYVDSHCTKKGVLWILVFARMKFS